nr:TnpV protein [uncultured Oscillibacter sp.]
MCATYCALSGTSAVLSEAATENIGKYGCIQREYLQEYQPEFYNQLFLSGKLHEHLLEINYTTYQRLERIMPELTKRAGAAKELKASASLKWAGLMNTCIDL